MPRSRSVGHSRSANWAARNSVPSDTEGTALFAPKPTPKCPMNTRLLPLVLPVARFTVGDPFDRLQQPALPRLVGLGLGDPFDVLAPVARAEAREGRLRLLARL